MTSPALSFLGDLRPAFVAHLAERLTDALCAGSQAHTASLGVRAPARANSALLFLLINGPATLTEIARTDGQSHQLLAARLAPLEKLNLVERFEDPKDARRKPYRLTRSGKAEAEQVRTAITAHAKAMADLFAETGHDLVAILDQTLEALRVRSAAERFRAAEQSAPAAARA